MHVVLDFDFALLTTAICHMPYSFFQLGSCNINNEVYIVQLAITSPMSDLVSGADGFIEF